jgi:hypothetical protein
MEAYPRWEIDVRGYRLRIIFDYAVHTTRGIPAPHGREGNELKVWQACCGRWGKQFRVRAGGQYRTFEQCEVCHQPKTAVFFYDEIRPLLPAEWWQEGPQ